MTLRPYIPPIEEASAIQQLREFFAAVNATDGPGELRRLFTCFYHELHREYPIPPNISTPATRTRARAAKK